MQFRLEEAAIIVVAMALFVGPLVLYFWLRHGPKRCPKCGQRNWGVWGIPVGFQRMHFHCKRCGNDYQGHWRLPG
jgi:transposase-like protein